VDVDDVAANLVKHEAVCAERWKTAFKRFDALDSQVNRIETMMITVAGTIIVGGAGVIWTILSMHY
tara:strand:- start:848 stop:1045 length:198 start_codon:yes stop_codon:yes gene_type:complete